MINKILKYFTYLFILNSVSGHYTPCWESLAARPLPEWYDDAKVGILIHWGPHCVPSYADEWFWKKWKVYKFPAYVKFMEKNHGPNFKYHTFAESFTAELYDPNEWAHLFRDSGAKYVIFTSKHHDGYALWPSKVAPEWNSVDLMPHRDLLGEFKTSIKKHTNLKFGVHYILEEPFNLLYIHDRSHAYTATKYVDEVVWPQLKDIIYTYKPEIIWMNGEAHLYQSLYWKTKEFLTWLYNESPVKETVVVSDRWAADTNCQHGDILTCFPPENLKSHKWEKPFPLDKTTWSYRAQTDLQNYHTSQEIIHELVKSVSLGGNFLLNVGPNRYGKFEPIYEERLRDMGNWLHINGEAIYTTKPWITHNDTKEKYVCYTMKKISQEQDRIIVYAIILNYPSDTNMVGLKSLLGRVDAKTDIWLLGYPRTLHYIEDEDGVHVPLPPKNLIDKFYLNHAWTLKFSLPNK